MAYTGTNRHAPPGGIVTGQRRAAMSILFFFPAVTMLAGIYEALTEPKPQPKPQPKRNPYSRRATQYRI